MRMTLSVRRYFIWKIAMQARTQRTVNGKLKKKKQINKYSLQHSMYSSEF